MAQSAHSTTRAAPFQTSGSRSLSHSALGRPSSAETAPNPLYLRGGFPVSWARRAWSAARTSIHMMAGRRGRPSASAATTVEAVASTEMPAISAAGTPLSDRAPRVARARADHHSPGSCSAQPGRGWLVSSSTAENTAGEPWRSNSPTRTPPVPKSIPIRYGAWIMRAPFPAGSAASHTPIPRSPELTGARGRFGAMPPFYADLHVHSKFSRACSRDCDLEHLALVGRRKGISVIGTGDFTHPKWFEELSSPLVPAEPGLFRLRPDVERSVTARLPASCR